MKEREKSQLGLCPAASDFLLPWGVEPLSPLLHIRSSGSLGCLLPPLYQRHLLLHLKIPAASSFQIQWFLPCSQHACPLGDGSSLRGLPVGCLPLAAGSPCPLSLLFPSALCHHLSVQCWTSVGSCLKRPIGLFPMAYLKISKRF